MRKIFRGMKGAPAVLGALRFPLLASPKLDGIRAIVRDGIVYSVANKPLPNRALQQKYANCAYYDGELIAGSATDSLAYRKTLRIVMAQNMPVDDITFHVFDHVEFVNEAYIQRVQRIDTSKGCNVLLHTSVEVQTLEQLLHLETSWLADGYEGVMLRSANGPYKYGRSTVNEGYLLKLKRFIDGEFKIVGFVERMFNGNEAVISPLGTTTRSSSIFGKSGHGDLGAFILLHSSGATFNVGSGFTAAERRQYWDIRHACVGRIAKIKYFAIGQYDVPRHPVWLGFRSTLDL